VVHHSLDQGHFPVLEAAELQLCHPADPRIIAVVWDVKPTRRPALEVSPRGARRFFFVEREEGGRLGTSRTAPLLRGRTGALDRPPWNAVEPPHGPVERRFLRPVVLGESVAPFRLLDTPLAVIPVEDGRLLDSAAAAEAGFPVSPPGCATARPSGTATPARAPTAVRG
jgi:hypothetical protein